MPLKKVFANLEAQMSKTNSFVQSEFSTIHTGKASPALVENIMVEAYSSQMRLKELAAITTPDPRMILVSPWDASVLDVVNKALQKNALGLNPSVDGKVIRVRVPELSEERRLSMDKIIKKIAEDGKVAIRNVRREANDEIKRLHKDGKISEDEMFKNEKKVQTRTDEHIKQIDVLLASKEKEILTV
jgi:ribosome recycling factor